VSGRHLLLAGLALLGLGAAGARSRPPAGPIAWLDDEERAFDESQRTGKPILVDAWAEWCTACKLMDRNTWSDPAVQRKVRDRFVPLRLDLTEESQATTARSERYGVEGLPTVLACRAPGCTPRARLTGYFKAAELLDFLESEASAAR